MRVMAIILNYRNAALSCRCAEGLLALSCSYLGICIVDNNSGEGLKELEGFCASSGVSLLQSDHNGGFSAGNNVGLRYACSMGYEYALIINPDVQIHDPSFFDKCLTKLDGDSSIAVLGPDVLHIEGFHQNPMREPTFLEELFWPLEALKERVLKRPLYHCDSSVSGYCRKVSGCCFFVRLSAIPEIGFLDEGVFLYCEEPILAARVSRAGLYEYYLSTAVAHHMHVDNREKTFANLERMNKSRLYYLRNYAGYGRVALSLLSVSKKLQLKFFSRRL